VAAGVDDAVRVAVADGVGDAVAVGVAVAVRVAVGEAVAVAVVVLPGVTVAVGVELPWFGVGVGVDSPDCPGGPSFRSASARELQSQM